MEAYEVKKHCWFNTFLCLAVLVFTLSISFGSIILLMLSGGLLCVSIWMMFKQIKLPKLPKIPFNTFKWFKRQKKLVGEDFKTDQTEEDKLFEEVEEELDE